MSNGMSMLSEYVAERNEKAGIKTVRIADVKDGFYHKASMNYIKTRPFIHDIRDAVEHVRQELRTRMEDLEQLTYVNKQKHATIRTRNGLYYILYKRDFFHSFGEIFGNVGGVGESINETCLNRAIFGNVDKILVVYSDGKIYSISPLKWRDYALRYRTIRKTTEKDMGYGNEKTISVSIKELERWNP